MVKLSCLVLWDATRVALLVSESRLREDGTEDTEAAVWYCEAAIRLKFRGIFSFIEHPPLMKGVEFGLELTQLVS
jgi:hypothetical protein